MELRSRINAAMKQAMKDKSTERLSTIRLINAAIKDRDIAARTEGKENGVADDEVFAILAKMTKQRQESAKTYEEAGRLDLSERELSEIKVIEEFLPTQLSEDEINSAVSARGALMTAALLIGLAQKMIDLSSVYVLDRTQFGKPIGSFQAVKHMLADVAVKIEFAKPAVYRAAYSLSENNPKSALHCAHAKFMCAQAAELACKNSIQAHGAMGYTWEMDLHIYMRKAWSMMACWGNEDRQQDIIFKTLSSTSEELGVLYTF